LISRRQLAQDSDASNKHVNSHCQIFLTPDCSNPFLTAAAAAAALLSPNGNPSFGKNALTAAASSSSS
jgi:hypothetical protein